MKAAVTATGGDVSSEVDPRFGRARWFLIVDTESDAVVAIDNSVGVEAGHGAGVASAQTVIDQGVSCVLTGHCGPKAFRALEAAGIDVLLGVSGSVSSAIERWRKGEFKAADGADVQGRS